MEEKSSQGFVSQMNLLVKAQVNDRIALYKLTLAEKAGKIIGKMVAGMIVLLLIFFVMLFISLMAGYWFSQLTDSLFTGYAIVAGIYLLLLIFMLLFGQKAISNKLADEVIREMFDEDEDEEDAE